MTVGEAVGAPVPVTGVVAVVPTDGVAQPVEHVVECHRVLRSVCVGRCSRPRATIGAGSGVHQALFMTIQGVLTRGDRGNDLGFNGFVSVNGERVN